MKEYDYHDLSYEEVVTFYKLLQDQVIHFRNLVSEIDISKYEHTEYISIVNNIYFNIFLSQEENVS
tara:strand:- start:1832 stop:2029 length:198 start_codon:yes stop_codon:yes gene_type:complete